MPTQAFSDSSLTQGNGACCTACRQLNRVESILFSWSSCLSLIQAALQFLIFLAGLTDLCCFEAVWLVSASSRWLGLSEYLFSSVIVYIVLRKKLSESGQFGGTS